MKINSVLYYRYLFRQATILFVVSFVLIGSINIILFFTNDFSPKNTWVFITGISIWLFPLYLFIITLVFLYKFISYKKQLKDLELYFMITNANVRYRIVKSNLRLGIVIPKKNQANLFSETIQVEIDKQKKLLSIKKGEFK